MVVQCVGGDQEEAQRYLRFLKNGNWKIIFSLIEKNPEYVWARGLPQKFKTKSAILPQRITNFAKISQKNGCRNN